MDLVIQESVQFPKNIQRYLGLIKQNVDQLLNLVNQLLDFKAAGNMNKPLIFSEIKALHLIESLKERFRTSYHYPVIAKKKTSHSRYQGYQEQIKIRLCFHQGHTNINHSFDDRKVTGIYPIKK